MRSQRLHVTPAGALSAVLGLALVSLLAHQLLSSNSTRPVPLQSVALLEPPPVQELAKPAEEEPPPELASSKELEVSDAMTGDVAQAASATPSDDSLGLDETGAGGGDVFGLVGKPGGRELLMTTGGPAGGNAAARYQQFAAALVSYLRDELNRVSSIRQACYTVDVGLRLSATGTIEDVQIRRSSGSRALDAQLRAALLDLPPGEVSPPPDTPWPVGIEIRSRRADCR